MKCYVCGKEYNDDFCPICEFSEVYVPGFKTKEEVRAILEPFIREHSAKFFPRVNVGIMLYDYVVSEDKTEVEETEYRDIFGGLSLEKPKNTVWLNRTFDRPSDAGTVPVELFVTVDGKQVRTFSVKVPQIVTAEQLKIGLRAETEARVSVGIQDEKGKTVFSEPCPLFV